MICIRAGVFVVGVLTGSQVVAQSQCEDLSNADRGHCLAEYGDFLEQQMVTAYTAAKSALEFKKDEFGGFNRRALEFLQPSQVSFEDFRKYFCEFDATISMKGSGLSIAYEKCRNEATEQRIKYLRSIPHMAGA
mgnify:CR=1 FL=1